MAESFEDRRKNVRIYRNYILSYHLKGNEHIKHEMSQVNNISKGGINFVATIPLPAGSQIIIEVRTPFLGDKIEFEGTVLDFKEKIPGLLYDIRIKFQGLSPQAQEVMEKIERAFTPKNK